MGIKLQIKIEIIIENVLTVETEILVLKYADALFGADRSIKCITSVSTLPNRCAPI